jgi:hypothetical protein
LSLIVSPLGRVHPYASLVLTAGAPFDRRRHERLRDASRVDLTFASAPASSAPVELETTHVLTIHAGRVASLHAYRDRTEALETAGLRE